MNDTYSRREGNVISLGTDKLAMELTLTPEGACATASPAKNMCSAGRCSRMSFPSK